MRAPARSPRASGTSSVGSGTRTNVPSWPVDGDQPFGAQLADGLAHGGAADAVFLREAQLAGQRLAGAQLSRLDLVAEQVSQLAEHRTVRGRIDHADTLRGHDAPSYCTYEAM
jgi:hypothetical protein